MAQFLGMDLGAKPAVVVNDKPIIKVEGEPASLPARWTRRRLIKARQRRRWPVVKAKRYGARNTVWTKPQIAAWQTSWDNGAVIRGMERTGKSRSKYCPQVCQAAGKR
jgi:hypothetical protein